MLPFVFEDGFGYERYCDYALDVPMYFVFRDGKYIDVAGESFRDFLDGKLPALPGEKPTLADWTDHLSTAFPEVRLKSFLEMRGADGGRWGRICALPALVGRPALFDRPRSMRPGTGSSIGRSRSARRCATPFRAQALDAPVPGGGTVRDLAARSARHRLGRPHASAPNLNSAGDNEGGFLDPLRDVVASGKTFADRLLDRYHGEWNGDVSHVYEEYSF